MKFLLWSMLMLTLISVSAQDKPPILMATKPQKGIYRDFQEFLNNAPSIQSPFIILCKSGDDKIERGTADYRVMLLDTATKRRDLKKFWGVYDGDAVYINEVVYGGPLNFKRMHGMGRYCYFKGSLVNNGSTVAGAGVAVGLVGGALAAAIIEIDGDYPYVLNINNGNVYLLDKETLKTILKKDEELLALYDEEERKSKKNTLLSYIAEYNQRHQDEIKYNRPEPITVTFYRRVKKERIDPIDLNVADTIQLSLEPNSLKQVTWYKDSLDVCIGSTCRTIPLQKKVVNYVECSWRSEQQEFNKVDNKVGEFYEREIRTTNEKKK
ncbi:MAG TPA: DUF6563 family protein [Chryseolinea sp.]|nr:DUF6563 family protein [Chryseolinea sp.]